MKVIRSLENIEILAKVATEKLLVKKEDHSVVFLVY